MNARVAMLIIAAALTGLAPGKETDASPAVIRTSAGRVEGLQRGGVQAFLGVPYAAPPVGRNRWRPPRPPQGWHGLRPAQDFGPSCYQEWPAMGFGPFTSEFIDTPKHSEDCLYLNVWRPVTAAAGLPVFFWIHGGGFGGGSGGVPVYDGAHLASRGVVVVSINYRVGPFGFMAHRDLTREAGSSGNYGLLDMIAALRWVRTNARALGADPDRITIAGQSAGAIAVDDLLAADEAHGLFSAAIAQSGTGMGINAIPLQEAENNGAKFAAQLGAASVGQLRALAPEKIQAGIPSYWGSANPATERIPFRPVLDGKLLKADPVDGAARPASAVNLMTGFTADEFVPPDPVAPAEFEKSVRRKFGSHADEFLQLYPHANAAEATASTRLLSRDSYMASLWIWADRRARLHVGPIYLYLYDHPAPLPISGGVSWGAFHTSEVPYVFGNLDSERRAYGAADTKIAEQIQSWWLNFIRARDPNGPGLPKWKPVAPGVQTVMELGDRPGMIPPVSTPERMAAFLRFVADGGRLSVS